MLVISIQFLSIFVSLLNCAAFNYAPIVQTKNGAVMGESVANGSYYSYKSVPYAEAPVAELRFEPPAPLRTNWTGTLNATKIASKCMQWSSMGDTGAIVGSEDCLYLNIFVPHVSRSAAVDVTKDLLPVMVFIHGGGLMWGSADFYGEDYIMQHGGIILVTLNYRLGPFGFLSTEDNEISGNMGFKDQVLAMQWVYDNIAFFGGNTHEILLAGWSAGGASVNFHLVSVMTDEKWFSTAVSFSGTALCPCHAIYQGGAYKKSKLLAEYLNCSADAMQSTKGLKRCLKEAKAERIVQQIEKFYKFSHHPFAIFGPVIEHPSIANRFLTNHVDQLMRSGITKAKPWLVTRTAEDGAFGTAEFLKKDESGRELIHALNEHWLEWAPIMLFFNSSYTEEEQRKLALNLKEQYFNGREIGTETYKDLERLFNEKMSKEHADEVVQLRYNFTPNAPLYGYVYDNPASFGYGQILAGREDWKFGTLHGDDVFLIFKTTVRETHPFSSKEQVISKHLINMLVQMAKTGIPEYSGVNLKQLTVSNGFKFTKIGEDGVASEN